MSKLQRIENVLLFLTLLFLPTQLGRHFWPQFSFVYSLPVDYLSPTIFFWDLLVILLVLSFVLKQQRVNKLALNLWLLFILSQSLSLLPFLSQPLTLGPGLVRLEQYLLSGLFGVYLASKNLRKIVGPIFWSLGLSVLGESILAIAQSIAGATIGFWVLGERTFTISTPGIAKFDFYGRQFLRPYATFPHPNVLAGFLVVTLTFLSWLKLSLPGAVKAFFFFVGAAAILLTVSRTAIVIGFSCAVFFLKPRGRIWFLLPVLIILPILYTRFSAIFDFDNLSLIRREQLSEVAIKMWFSSPYLGVGLNNFIPQASDQILVGPSRFLQPAHNIFLLILSETGLVGFVGFLFLIGLPIWKRVLLPIWLIILFLGLFDHYFLTLPQGYRLLFLIWGVSLSVTSSKISTHEDLT